jgi:hypothetical protein
MNYGMYSLSPFIVFIFGLVIESIKEFEGASVLTCIACFHLMHDGCKIRLNFFVLFP